MNFFQFFHLVLCYGGFIIPCHFLSSVLFWWNWLYFLSSYFLWAFEKHSSCFSQSGSFHPVFSYDSVLRGRHCSRHSGYLMSIWRASQVVLVVKTRLPKQETHVYLWVGKVPWRRKWLPTPVSLPGKSVDREAWRATVLDHRELDTAERLSTKINDKCRNHIV